MSNGDLKNSLITHYSPLLTHSHIGLCAVSEVTEENVTEEEEKILSLFTGCSREDIDS